MVIVLSKTQWQVLRESLCVYRTAAVGFLMLQDLMLRI